jgi:AcrR family transcriptional regulator
MSSMGPSEGWERRMADTRAAIVDAALTLFERDGFDGVTVAEVAEAAGVGERTVFRYFPTKERIVLDEGSATFDQFVDALHEVPDEVPVADAISITNRSFVPALDDALTDARRMALVRTTASLHRAWLADLDHLGDRMAGWIARRSGTGADQIEVRAAAASLVATYRMLVEDLYDGDVETHLDRADRALGFLAPALEVLEPAGLPAAPAGAADEMW